MSVELCEDTTDKVACLQGKHKGIKVKGNTLATSKQR